MWKYSSLSRPSNPVDIGHTPRLSTATTSSAVSGFFRHSISLIDLAFCRGRPQDMPVSRMPLLEKKKKSAKFCRNTALICLELESTRTLQPVADRNLDICYHAMPSLLGPKQRFLNPYVSVHALEPGQYRLSVSRQRMVKSESRFLSFSIPSFMSRFKNTN